MTKEEGENMEHEELSEEARRGIILGRAIKELQKLQTRLQNDSPIIVRVHAHRFDWKADESGLRSKAAGVEAWADDRIVGMAVGTAMLIIDQPLDGATTRAAEMLEALLTLLPELR